MRNFLLIILFDIMVSQFCCAGSNVSGLDKNIKFSTEKGTIQSFLNELTSNYGIVFSYEPSEIPLQKEIVLSKKELKLNEALSEIFKNTGIEFIVKSNVIILKKSAKSADEVKKNKSTLSGIIKDAKSGETLVGSTIYFAEAKNGEVANEYGFYSITVPEGQYNIQISNIGYQTLTIDTIIKGNVRLDINLSPAVVELDEVIVNKKQNRLIDFQQGISRVEMKTIKELPSLAGEADILRNIQMLPGVNSMTEVGGDFQVRGGSWDQNLMMLDEAMVYNSNHMYGVYSTFNTDIIKDIKFYKSSIPASYGGRVSSVMDITQKDGDMKSFHVNGGLGLIMSKLSLEGPLIDDKCSFIIAARRSTFEPYLRYTNNQSSREARPYFYDINSKVNYVINANNRIYLSNYVGQDIMAQNINESYANTIKFGNVTSTLRFNHLFSERLFSNTSLIYSQYDMSVQQHIVSDSSYRAQLGLQHFELKNEFVYSLQRHKIDFGFRGVYYIFHPGHQQAEFVDTANNYKIDIPAQYAAELAVYLEDVMKLTPRLELQMGLRFSNFNSLGKADVPVFSVNEPRNVANIIDTLHYGQNKIVKTYNNLEPRLSLRYNISENQMVTVSYNKIVQYIQLVTRTFSPLPYDMWRPSDSYIKPLTGHQFSAGWFYQWMDESFDFSVETYYKLLNNVLEVKPGTDVELNKSLEVGLLQGQGKAYGLEFGLTKTAGRLTGMCSYTRSKTMRKVDGKFVEERINLGNWYVTDYDIPNKFNLAGIYKVSSRFSLTANFLYQTGRPLSLPSGQFIYFNSVMPYYAGKNLSRYPADHRLDLGAVLKGKQKPGRKWQGCWTLSVYNVYGRENPYVIGIRHIPNSRNTQVAELWFFNVVPSLTYSFKF